MVYRILAALAAALLSMSAGAQSEEGDSEPAYRVDDAVYQLAPSVVLAQGLLEGSTRFSALLRFGDFGLGALSPIDGEVIVLDGVVYQASHEGGRLRQVAPGEQTPFAYVKRFSEDRRVELPPVESYDAFARELDRRLPTSNLLYAVRIDGVFERLKLRSVPRQRAPYPPIDKVVLSQKVFEEKNIRGTIVAFRFPSYLGSTSGSGYHMHFVDSERRIGGHVLDLRSPALSVSVDESYGLSLILPDDTAFKTVNFDGTGDTGDALKRAVRPE